MVDEDGEVAEGEIVDGLPVVADEDDGVLEARQPFGGAVSVPTVQAAALLRTAPACSSDGASPSRSMVDTALDWIWCVQVTL